MIATTTTRIRAAVIRTGSTPDQDAPVAVLTQQLDANEPLPPALIMDQAGGMGKTRAQVHAVSDGETRMVAQVPQSCADSGARFTPADFHLSADGTRCTCPNGVTSTRLPTPQRRWGELPLLWRAVSGLSVLDSLPGANEHAAQPARGLLHALPPASP